MKRYVRFSSDVLDGYRECSTGDILEIDFLLDWSERVSRRMKKLKPLDKVYAIMLRYQNELNHRIDALILY